MQPSHTCSTCSTTLIGRPHVQFGMCRSGRASRRCSPTGTASPLCGPTTRSASWRSWRACPPASYAPSFVMCVPCSKPCHANKHAHAVHCSSCSTADHGAHQSGERTDRHAIGKAVHADLTGLPSSSGSFAGRIEMLLPILPIPCMLQPAD